MIIFHSNLYIKSFYSAFHFHFTIFKKSVQVHQTQYNN